MANNPVFKKYGFDNPFYYQQETQLQRRHTLSKSSSTSSFSSSSSLDISPDEPPESSLTTASSEEDGDKGISTAMECQQCMRQGAPLFCFSCGFWMAKGRVAQPCSKHPKVIFYTDFKSCPKCKQTGCLQELD